MAGLAQKIGGVGFPWGTLTVNVLGCLAIGVLWAIHEQTPLAERTGAFLFVGLLGSFTTFSTFSLDTIHLVRDGAAVAAFAYVLLSNILGLAAAYAAYLATRSAVALTAG